MKTLVVSCVALVAIASLSTGAAEAGGPFEYSYGTAYGTTYSSGLGGSYYALPSYSPSIYRTTYVHTQPSVVWHNTSHWDRVPASISYGPGGLRYNPGGYVWHNDGHYDVVGGGLPDHDYHYHP